MRSDDVADVVVTDSSAAEVEVAPIDDVAADVATDIDDGAEVAEVADVTDVAEPIPLGSCVGTSVPLLLAGDLPYTTVAIGTNTGAFLVDWGTTGSAIDPSGFAPTAPTPVAGTQDRWLGFMFFGPWSEVVLWPQDFSAFDEPVRQAGILGTDFLALNTFVVDWDAGVLSRAAVGEACTEAELAAAGFRALSTEGYFARDLDQVDDDVPNVPTIPVRVGGFVGPAQIDTGYDDRLVGPAMNINRAFFDSLDVTLVRAAELDLVLTTCVPGVSEPVLAHRLPDGVAVELVGLDDAAVRREADAIIFLKDTPAAAAHCGGIGTWVTPAAQLGVSFVARARVVVFDPERSRVWLPPQ